jgi:hypothetical protein
MNCPSCHKGLASDRWRLGDAEVVKNALGEPVEVIHRFWLWCDVCGAIEGVLDSGSHSLRSLRRLGHPREIYRVLSKLPAVSSRAPVSNRCGVDPVYVPAEVPA